MNDPVVIKILKALLLASTRAAICFEMSRLIVGHTFIWDGCHSEWPCSIIFQYLIWYLNNLDSSCVYHTKIVLHFWCKRHLKYVCKYILHSGTNCSLHMWYLKELSSETYLRMIIIMVRLTRMIWTISTWLIIFPCSRLCMESRLQTTHWRDRIKGISLVTEPDNVKLVRLIYDIEAFPARHC